MEKLRFIWDYAKDGNVDHIAANFVEVHEAQYVMQYYEENSTSPTSGRPARIGHTRAGRSITVVFEWLDEITVFVITAWENE